MELRGNACTRSHSCLRAPLFVTPQKRRALINLLYSTPSTITGKRTIFLASVRRPVNVFSFDHQVGRRGAHGPSPFQPSTPSDLIPGIAIIAQPFPLPAIHTPPFTYFTPPHFGMSTIRIARSLEAVWGVGGVLFEGLQVSDRIVGRPLSR